jgi:hypothetical protein
MLFLGMLTENQPQITRLQKATRKWLACEEQPSHLDDLTLETPVWVAKLDIGTVDEQHAEHVG